MRIGTELTATFSAPRSTPSVVMAGLDPATQPGHPPSGKPGWIPGSSPGMTTESAVSDGRTPRTRGGWVAADQDFRAHHKQQNQTTITGGTIHAS